MPVREYAAPVRERQRNLRRVLRDIGAGGKPYKVGEVVDVTGWRNWERLVDQRRLSDYVVDEADAEGA
jgi:hypothetical protein